VTLWGTLVANEVKKMSNKFADGARRQFGATDPVPLPKFRKPSNQLPSALVAFVGSLTKEQVLVIGD